MFTDSYHVYAVILYTISEAFDIPIQDHFCPTLVHGMDAM